MCIRDVANQVETQLTSGAIHGRVTASDQSHAAQYAMHVSERHITYGLSHIQLRQLRSNVVSLSVSPLSLTRRTFGPPTVTTDHQYTDDAASSV